MALTDAGVEAAEVGYVNAHGTSTPAGDAAETRVLKLALGEEQAYATPVSSTKGATGHTLGASGALEAVFTVLALQRGVLPPTINQTSADPDCDLDYIANTAREEQVEVAISNSFGFGGHNTALVFRRLATSPGRAL
jgi:3-oxoacyl-[acyl-carrier-protein] synthase II